MYKIKYVLAKNTSDASNLFECADEPKFLAGGMTLIPTLKQRLLKADILIDLKKCNLNGIKEADEKIIIGSMTTHAEVENSTIIKNHLPAISYLASKIGDRQVRNCGTIGGSIANNDPAACYPAALLSLSGKIITNKRTIESSKFFVGMFETALDDNEIITFIELPKNTTSFYKKFSNPASGYAIVGIFLTKFSSKIQIAVTGAGQDGVFRAKNFEEILNQNFSSAALSEIDVSDEELLNDLHASSDYRAHLIKVLIGQIVNHLNSIEI